VIMPEGLAKRSGSVGVQSFFSIQAGSSRAYWLSFPDPSPGQMCNEQHVSVPHELQLPFVGRWGAGVQRGYVDAAYRTGLAGAYRAHAAQRDGGGYGDGVAVRAAVAVAAAERICRRSHGSTQVAAPDPG